MRSVGKKLKNKTAFCLCCLLLLPAVQPQLAQASIPAVQPQLAQASIPAGKAEVYQEADLPKTWTASASDAWPATMSYALRRSSSLGDIWDGWSGKTSFEFLSGSQGDGSEEKPFLIKNREQLMGLSQLTAMGMIVLEGGGADYPGDYSGCFFALGGNIDLQGIDWIPIGFYRDSSERDGEVFNAFTGDFDGNGYTIKNLKMNKFGNYSHVGLFGAVQNAVIHDVTMVTDGGFEIRGTDRVGIAAGYAADSVIRDVTVRNGFINASGIAGGIAGEVAGTVIENCSCEKVMINAAGGADIIYAGGIAGIASDSVIADCEVSTGTGDGSTSRIQGTGYIGGIVGFQNATDIYNVRVSGGIGGYHSASIGGITGMYASGKLKVARFEGEIGNSRLGSMAREGTFIGTRKGPATNFNYAEEVAYLFADSGEKISANVCGSEIPDDNDYGYDAHIGYWHSQDLYCTLVQGGVEKDIRDRYFYEELEAGILSVMDEEEDGTFTIDHYAPDSLGRPARGYLVIVNQVDTIAGGQYFDDVATLEVRGSSQFAKPLDKNHRGAAAAGSTVHITTAPNNTELEKFQMDGSPYYYNAAGKKVNAAYSEQSHAYDFRMPAENIAVQAVYRKVAVSVSTDPKACRFSVTQTRSGNRKNPSKVTEVRDHTGKLLAKYINGQLEQGTSVRPVTISATVDSNNDVEDSRVKWSIDDPGLIILDKNDEEGADGYTGKSASITVNLDAPFFKTIIRSAEEKQAEENYQYRIPNTIYGAGHQNGGVAVLTAESRPAVSFEGKPCAANCRIDVTFQIIDNTLVAAERAALDKQELEYTVTRILTGDRMHAQESITVTPPQSLQAVFEPDFFTRDEVAWTVSDPAVLSVSKEAHAYKEASVAVYQDSKWIRDIIASDQGIHANDPYARLTGSGQRTASVTVDGKDRLGNHAEASCAVTVRFVTDDRTRIVPQELKLNKDMLEFHLGYRKAGDIRTETVARTGFAPQQLSALVLPDLRELDRYRPYNRGVVWTSSDPSALTVDASGCVEAVDRAQWIEEALSKAPYYGEKTVVVTASTIDSGKSASCEVKLTFQADCIEADREAERFNIVLTKTGPFSRPVLTYSGIEPKTFKASLYSANDDVKTIQWNSADEGILSVTQDGVVTPVLPDDKQETAAEWIREAMKEYPYSGTIETEIIPSAMQGAMKDPVKVILTFTVDDKTYSSGNSGGSGGGGGKGSGAGGSAGITPSGRTQASEAPAGSVTGTWTQAAGGQWLFAAGRTYADEWAYINNPYASFGQPKASWFRFGRDGFLVTGWYTDTDGRTYYLNPVSDGTLGQMATGWQMIDGDWYYFNEKADGAQGQLLSDTVIDGIYRLDERGRWLEE